ncbi:importin-11-like isoform X2 [Bacillus rossius redtenbacheri]|uniref:importin-11-like isoform X2 n=1 Tax=Bacillus rossius redtenbacheri TaxID=93214 RepID=UPI002FDDB3D1
MELNAAGTLVLETLQQAASQDVGVLKPAEQRLKQWETEPGFYSVLLNIVSNHAIDVNVRWLAVLYFKNGIDRFWRKAAPNAISEAEKIPLRQGLASCFTEPVNQIATQIAVLISKIARVEWPRDWPELIPVILEAVKSNNPLVQHRAILTLHHVVKTLSSKRLVGDRKLFQELTAGVFEFVLSVWSSHLQAFLSQMSEETPTMAESLEKALLTLRILRKLVVYGYRNPHESQEVRLFLSMVFDRAKTMLECRKSLLSRDKTALAEVCEKFVIHLTKILLDVLEHHPLSFVEYIHMSLEFAGYYVFTPTGEGLLFERFIVQCLNLVKAILLCVEYKPGKVVEDKKEPEVLRAHELKMSFFTEVTLTEFCRKLVTHYFLLTKADLEQWDSDPEGFAIDEGGESWKYSLRPCTETVFVTLFHEFRATLSPVLLSMVQSSHSLVPPDDLTAILRKDAVYNAVGLAAFDFYDEVNFDQWFSTTLTQELRVKEGNYRVIRRRVTWLIGQWTGVKLSQELRPALYAAMLPLLGRGEDMAVRLTASSTLKLAIDDFEFNTDQFLPFLETAFSLLFALLQEAQECDTKMHVLYVLSFIIERVGFSIRPFANSLVQYLPQLWQQSAEHNMLRCAIVSTMVHLVKAFGMVTETLYPFLVPMVALSTDLSQPAHVYLMEDGLELWLAVLENSSQVTPELLQLFRNMPHLLEHCTDNIRTCFYIIQANILLAPDLFLKTYGEPIIMHCDDMLSDMRSEGVVLTMRLVETYLRAAPSLATDVVKPILPRVFLAVYKGEEYPMVMSMYLSVMSRVLLNSLQAFSQVVQKVANLVGERQEVVLDKILDVWLDKMALVTQLERRKLLGLALASLLTAQSSSLMFSNNHLSSGSEDDVDYETEHDHRRKLLSATDPVYTTVLRDYFQRQVAELQSQVGPVQFEQLIQTIDVETLQQARAFIVM